MNNYLNSLRSMLDRFVMDNEEKEDILNDYHAMIEEAKDKGLSDEEIVRKLGSIEEIYRELKMSYKLKKKIKKGEKIIGIMPFLSVIAFIILGYFDYWHPGWLVFLSIPMSAIIIEGINNDPQYKLTSISPFVTVIIFIVLVYSGYAHPGWLIFLLTPVMSIIESNKKMSIRSLSIGLSVFIGFTAFIFISSYYETYHPTWLFLLSPIFIASVSEKNKRLNLLIGITLLISIIGYVYLGLTQVTWTEALLVFIPYVVLLIVFNRLNIIVSSQPLTVLLKGSVIFSLIAFVLLGYFFDAWHPAWLVFLFIPIAGVLENERKHRLTSIMPFVSVIIFILLGYFLDAWHPGWLVFLLIPIAGVLED